MPVKRDLTGIELHGDLSDFEGLVENRTESGCGLSESLETLRWDWKWGLGKTGRRLNNFVDFDDEGFAYLERELKEFKAAAIPCFPSLSIRFRGICFIFS